MACLSLVTDDLRSQVEALKKMNSKEGAMPQTLCEDSSVPCSKTDASWTYSGPQV